MDGRANAHHLPRGRDDQQRFAEEDERHAHREYGRAAATLGYAQLLEEATASPVLKLPKLLLCGHDPTARAERDTHAVNRHAHVWHVQVTVCVLTPGLLRCVCVLLLTFSLCVEKSFHAHAARVARRGTRQPPRQRHAHGHARPAGRAAARRRAPARARRHTRAAAAPPPRGFSRLNSSIA